MRFFSHLAQVGSTKIRVTYDRFQSAYDRSTECIEVVKGWASQRPMFNKAYVEQAIKAHIQIAVAQVGNSIPEAILIMQTKPHKAVLAGQSYAIGKLALAFETSRVMMTKPGDQKPSNGLACTVPKELIEDHPTVPLDRSFFLMPMLATDFQVPAWAVRQADDDSKVNMAIKMQSITMNVSTKFGRENRSEKVVIEVPILVNTVAIADGSELFVKKPAAQPKKVATKRALPSVFAGRQVGKKQK